MDQSLLEQILKRLGVVERWLEERGRAPADREPDDRERGGGERGRDYDDSRRDDHGGEREHGHEHSHYHSHYRPRSAHDAHEGGLGFEEKRVVDLIVRLVAERVDAIVARRLAEMTNMTPKGNGDNGGPGTKGSEGTKRARRGRRAK